jgi:serine/threonine protein kinase
MDKFKGQEFTFKAIGIASHVYGKFSEGTKALLGKLLHHDPNKRMKLKDMFLDICPEIGDHYRDQKMDVPPSRITVPQSSKIANLNMSSTNALKDIANNFAQRQKNRDQMLQSSNLNRNTLTSEE